MKLVGSLIYNGIAFGGSSQVTLNLETVRDDADRTTAYVKHTLTVRAVLYDPNDTDGQFTDLRAKLTETGSTLMFTGQGAGTISVNFPYGQKDVKWGPKPRIVAWAPIGSLRACEVQWTCDFCLPSCTALTDYTYRFLAFNFGIAYSIDHRGSTNRTITGYLEIPLTRSGRDVPDTADSYRSAINPAIPAEFQRMQQDFRLSADKSRLDFTIVDVEIPSDNPYPPGVARIDARHSVMWTRNARQGGFMRNRIAMDIEMAYDQPTVNAYAIFLTIAKERMQKATSSSTTLLIEDVTVEEGLFDRTSSFSVSYRFTYDVTTLVMTAMVNTTGVFTQLACFPSWATWAASIAPDVGVGGYQCLKAPAAADKIIDICGAAPSLPFSYTNTPPAAAAIDAELGLTNTVPDTGKSWLQYDHWIEVVRENPIARQAILQAPPPAEPAADQQPDAQLSYPAATGTADTMQVSGQPKFWAIVRGVAMRAGHNIPRPFYPDIGNSPAKERTGRFSQKATGKWLGVTIYTACWELVYELDKSPGDVDNLFNLEQIVE